MTYGQEVAPSLLFLLSDHLFFLVWWFLNSFLMPDTGCWIHPEQVGKRTETRSSAPEVGTLTSGWSYKEGGTTPFFPFLCHRQGQKIKVSFLIWVFWEKERYVPLLIAESGKLGPEIRRCLHEELSEAHEFQQQPQTQKPWCWDGTKCPSSQSTAWHW